MNTEKLTIEHLAPYLPHGLKMIFNSAGGRIITLTGITNQGDMGISITNGHGAMWLNSCGFKPILRPLSDFNNSDDLIKINEFVGLWEWCEAYDYYFDIWFDDLANVDKLILQAPYKVFCYFIANHFDVFSLIPKNLAIDINTITP